MRSTRPSSLSVYWYKWRDLLGHRVDGASLAAFRVCFGLLMCWHLLRQLLPAEGTTTLRFLYVDTNFHFKYSGFQWVTAFGEPWMSLFVGLLAVCALAVALGVWYRGACCMLFFGFSYLFLIEAAKYNNHYYLMCLLAGLLCVMPASAVFSVDGWRRQRADGEAELPLVPWWTIFVLRGQIFIMYFYAAVAKYNGDWLTGIPLQAPAEAWHEMLSSVLPLPTAVDIRTVALAMAWTGLLFDSTIGFLLLVRRTRMFGLGLTGVFHGINFLLFPIGVFPLLAFSVTWIFLDPDWPRRVWSWIKKPTFFRPDWTWLVGGAVAFPIIGALLAWKTPRRNAVEQQARAAVGVAVLVVVYLGLQMTIPLRHFTLPSNASWSEEGQDFSWRMMLRAKTSGHVIYHVQDDVLVYRDAQQLSRIRWEQWPEERPREIFVPVDSHRFDWRDHPGLTFTFEPCVGYRAVHPLTDSLSAEQIAERKQLIARQWENAFERRVDVLESISLSAAVAELKCLLASHTTSDFDTEASIKKLEALAAAVGQPGGSGNSERKQASLAYFLNDLAKHTRNDPEMQDVLYRVGAFELQGATTVPERFLIIDDPQLRRGTIDLAALTAGDSYLIWVDLSRLSASGWQQLPQWFPAYETGELKIVWNYFRDLNRIQRNRFGIRPRMLQQYACYVANQWEGIHGRRPEVRVTSLAMMNYRRPQYLVDPDADLASVDYRVLAPNRWILPLKSRPLRLSDWQHFGRPVRR